MAGKISELTAVSTAVLTDEFEELQSGTNLRITILKILSLMTLTGTGSPIGSITPDFLGQEYHDTTPTPDTVYKSIGTTNADWTILNQAGSGIDTLPALGTVADTDLFIAADASDSFAFDKLAMSDHASYLRTGQSHIASNVAATLTKGYNNTVFSAGTKSSGTFTPDPGENNIQHCVGGGAFTLGVPATDCSIVLDILNNASAGAITTSSYGKVTGDSFTTTNTNLFRCFISVNNGNSLLNVVAMQ